MTSHLTTAFLFKRVRKRRRQDIGLREIATDGSSNFFEAAYFEGCPFYTDPSEGS
jgi:hypothetical protein